MRPVLWGAVCLALALSASQAHATLIGQDVTVTFQEDGFADVITPVTVGMGPEIAAGDGSDIGTDVFLGGEFIDIGESIIEYQIRGDGPAHATSGYQTTGFGPSAVYHFTDLIWADEPGGFINGVTVELFDVIGVELGNEVTFSANAVSLSIGTLGVLESGGQDLGTIRMILDVVHVPEPAAALLLLVGVAALAIRP